jgi:hypothetical protein
VHGRSETACPSSLERQTAEFKLVARFRLVKHSLTCLGPPGLPFFWVRIDSTPVRGVR